MPALYCPTTPQIFGFERSLSFPQETPLCLHAFIYSWYNISFNSKNQVLLLPPANLPSAAAPLHRKGANKHWVNGLQMLVKVGVLCPQPNFTHWPVLCPFSFIIIIFIYPNHLIECLFFLFDPSPLFLKYFLVFQNVVSLSYLVLTVPPPYSLVLRWRTTGHKTNINLFSVI